MLCRGIEMVQQSPPPSDHQEKGRIDNEVRGHSRHARTTWASVEVEFCRRVPIDHLPRLSVSSMLQERVPSADQFFTVAVVDGGLCTSVKGCVFASWAKEVFNP